MFTFKLTRYSWITKCLTNLNMFLFYIIQRTSVTSLAKRLKKECYTSCWDFYKKISKNSYVSFAREVLLVPNKEWGVGIFGFTDLAIFKSIFRFSHQKARDYLFEYLVFSKKPCVFLDLAYDVVFSFFFDLVYRLSSARMFSIMRPNHAPSS